MRFWKWLRLRVSHDVANQISTRAAVIQSLSWGWRIHIQAHAWGSRQGTYFLVSCWFHGPLLMIWKLVSPKTSDQRERLTKTEAIMPSDDLASKSHNYFSLILFARNKLRSPAHTKIKRNSASSLEGVWICGCIFKTTRPPTRNFHILLQTTWQHCSNPENEVPALPYLCKAELGTGNRTRGSAFH